MSQGFDVVFDEMLMKELANTNTHSINYTSITSNKYFILIIFILSIITFYYIFQWYLAKNANNYLVKSISQTNENIPNDILTKLENASNDMIQWLRNLMSAFFAKLHIIDGAVKNTI